MTFGRRGVTRTVGLPGTGLYYTSRTGNHSGFHSAHTEAPLDPQTQAKADHLAGIALVAIALVVALATGLAIGSLIGHH